MVREMLKSKKMNEVTGKLQKKHPYLINIHCLTYMFSLSLKDLVKNDKEGKVKFKELTILNEFIY